MDWRDKIFSIWFDTMKYFFLFRLILLLFFLVVNRNPNYKQFIPFEFAKLHNVW